VILWMTGGPGCSSELALFFENGPYTVDSSLNLLPNPYSWNSFANLIFIDQPVGTGFSYANSDYIFDEQLVGEEMYTFLQMFFAMYPQYAKQKFFIIGESYGGHYVPSVALRVVEGNNNHDGPQINLKGIAIGNGWVDPVTQYGGYGPFAFANNLIDSSVYASMNQTYQQCQQFIDNQEWNEAESDCGSIMQQVLDYAGNINYYNIDLQCNPPPLCYDLSNITNYLNLPSTQLYLGVNIPWEPCSDPVNEAFGIDKIESFKWEIPALLSNGTNVVIYSGDLDLICNWMGGNMWVDSMVWPGQSAFQAAPFKPWFNNKTQAGVFKQAKNFSFVRVFQAGHMVPHDQPSNALSLLQQILMNTI